MEHVNLGVGLRGGQEGCPHRVRAYLDAFPEHACLALDLMNAFNACLRDHVHTALEAHAPELLPYFATHYAVDNQLILADGSILTAERPVAKGWGPSVTVAGTVASGGGRR